MFGRIETAWVNFQASPYFWDVIMAGCLMLTVLGVLCFVVWLLGLPGRIAISRNHPDAEAVYTMGWVGFLAVVPWIQALIWAFKPTDKIDIRYFPDEERKHELEDLQRLSRFAYGRDLPKEQVEALMRRLENETAAEADRRETGSSPDPTAPQSDKREI
ncbi:DUF3302 domain-containing protein [Fluviibacterium sp. DFM31]|uniref:DUF3302 domain-containing protein n=1 Tax=Meridianimarinicoccus marinus TaxID=3231483 RepID=A0ABV3LBQ3_9RHOB